VSKSLGAFVALLSLVWLAVFAWARMPGWTPLGPDERAAAMRLARDALDGRTTAAPASGGFGARLTGPAIVTLYADGKPAARVEGRGATVGAALADAARALALAGRSIAPELRRRGRLKIDLVRARAPMVARIAPLFAFSLIGGVDGIGLEAGGREVLLTADDLLAADVLAAYSPARALELELGTDGAAVLRRLAERAGVARIDTRRLVRFRAESFVEPAGGGAPLPVFRGNPPGPPLTVDNLRRAAIAGGRYLLRQQQSDGSFVYEYYTLEDQSLFGGSSYSLPRHAGAAYFLAQLYGATREPALLDGARRALDYLMARAPGACDRPERACVGEAGDHEVDLGSTAMALLAVTEHQRVSGDRRYQPWARRLAAFLVFMQKPDGDFCHLYDPSTDARDCKTKLLYYSGEAAFALSRLGALPEFSVEPRWADAVDRGLLYVTGPAYDYLAGQFFFGEDHWTCLAADSAWDRLPPAHREGYSRFCDRFAAFLRRAQFRAGDDATVEQPDLVGAYGFTPFLPPHATPVGSRSEAALSVYAMDRRRGVADGDAGRATRAQILDGVRFLLAHQITDDAAWLMPNPSAAAGGFLMSDVKRYIRIDFIQHSCSAMLRAVEIM
jgi:hypothetical protein